MGRKRPGGGLSATQQAAKFLGVSVVSGAVLAGLALPAVGALGLAAAGTMEGFDDIPAMMERPPLSQKTTILDAEGNKIADVYSRNRTVIPLEEMSDYVIQGLVDTEDARFYDHGAIDLQGIIRALTQNVESGGVEQGASTLTQQYVKNVLVEAAGDDQAAIDEATSQSGAEGVGRKIREMKYAIQVEQELTKDEILENYLNITYFGQQAYGIEAASQRYFSKHAADLELWEGALLAGLVQSPSAYDPTVNEEAALNRRNTVLDHMAAEGDISEAEAEEAKQHDLGLNLSEPRNGCITAEDGAGFFCDYVREEFLSNPVFGETEQERQALWDLGGMTITTTLDPQAQQAANQAATDGANPDDEAAATVVQVEPGSGHILSMAQSRPYGLNADEHQTQLNLNVSHEMGGSAYGFQVGSTFKPIVAATALEEGISPAQTYHTDSETSIPMADYEDCDGNELGSASERTWEVSNELDSERGTWDMTDALGQSINTYFANLERDAGLCEVAHLAADMGVERGDNQPLEVLPTLTLGGQTIAPLQMANAYATFANHGTYCSPVSITRVTNADGEDLEVPDADCHRVMSEHTADSVTVMLRGVVEDGTGSQVGLTDRDNAGKTGTTDERKDVWFVGYTPEVSTAVRVGGDAEPFPMEDLYIGGRYVEKASGSGVAGPIWRQAMTGALQGVPPSSFAEVNVPRGNDHDDEDRDDHGNGDDDRDNGGNGGNGGGAGGGGDAGGAGDGGDDGWPDLPGLPGGNGNGGNGNGNGGNWP
ncbi:transglycosylase domain-containing protein [Streptomyces hoynatensis]|uniref:Penicillin-binding protein n=1 Tax=Streptomyces hoynatensis TaxID=1141874 RepID=A0A3A9Z5F1_9ACTN|nr:transglycosylase domain-containing protein [Streptomyces hoynatensis]RKN43084.1 penicillin-binding protein [Streptomyces hoynatensis]